jgi:hypothetical protein
MIVSRGVPENQPAIQGKNRPKLVLLWKTGDGNPIKRALAAQYCSDGSVDIEAVTSGPEFGFKSRTHQSAVVISRSTTVQYVGYWQSSYHPERFCDFALKFSPQMPIVIPPYAHRIR